MRFKERGTSLGQRADTSGKAKKWSTLPSPGFPTWNELDVDLAQAVMRKKMDHACLESKHFFRITGFAMFCSRLCLIMLFFLDQVFEFFLWGIEYFLSQLQQIPDLDSTTNSDGRSCWCALWRG